MILFCLHQEVVRNGLNVSFSMHLKAYFLFAFTLSMAFVSLADRVILDLFTVNTNTDIAIIKPNLTKHTDGFSLGFTVNFLRKILTFYVRVTSASQIFV